MKFILYISQPEVGSAKEFLTQNGFQDLIPVLVDKHKVYIGLQQILVKDF